MRIKFLIQNLLKDPFLVFTNEEILKLGKELNSSLELLTVIQIKSTLEKHLDKKNSKANEELLEKIKQNVRTNKFSIPKIKELLLKLQDSDFSTLKEKDFFHLEDVLERTFKKINLSKNLEIIRELEESIPVPFRELYYLESNQIEEIKVNQHEDEQEKILEQTKKLVSQVLKKILRYKTIFSKLKSESEKTSISLLNKLSKKEKDEISNLANLNIKDEQGKSIQLHLTEKNIPIWLDKFIKSKKNMSIFDIKK